MLIASPGSWSQRITDILLLGSVAIPGVVLGVGYIFFYNLPFITNNFVNIYKTLPLLVLALIANAVPGRLGSWRDPSAKYSPPSPKPLACTAPVDLERGARPICR